MDVIDGNGAPRWAYDVRTVLAAALLGLAVPSLGVAFTLKSLIMPGPVIEAHADIEETCESCHEKTDGERQSDLCFVCHTEVGEDRATLSGFHGRDSRAAANQCSSCHTEHEGRAAVLARVDTATFAHADTDFALDGAHRDAPCAACHTSGAPYRAAPQQCNACHADDDVHERSLGTQCGSCHAATAWARTSFDHATTRFALSGAHATAECGSCHVDRAFAGTRSDCASCHRSDDVHAGRNGQQCGSCHGATAWNVPQFDHVAASGFALRGSHASLTCETCHVTNVAAALPRSCGGCHEGDDRHQGKLGASCGDCHGSSRWGETGFDHAAVSAFALVGAHAALECTSCHRNGVEAALERDCASCHADDPHRGQLGAQCASCHSETAWHSEIRFDHDLVAFALLGKHAALGCDACHASAAFHDAGAECSDCHAGDDAHGGAFGAQCASCHNPAAWQSWTFDHDAQTDFALTGAHDALACASCHSRPIEALATAARDCGGCHRRNDPHLGRYGADCGGCHTTTSFEELRGR